MKLLTMSPQSILSKEQEQTPEWLMKYRAGRRFPRKKFFGSRIVYYPAAGADFHAVRIFGSSDAAHCFVMSDYLVREDQAHDFLMAPHLPDYACIEIQSLPLEEVWKTKWTQHFFPSVHEIDQIHSWAQPHPFAIFAVYEGANRLAVLYLGCESVEVYDRLFCQGRSPKPPYGILVQNHGMGGDWNQMANPDCYVAQLADEFGRPRWLIGEDGRENWRDYEPVSDITCGGMNLTARRLFSNSILA